MVSTVAAGLDDISALEQLIGEMQVDSVAITNADSGKHYLSSVNFNAEVATSRASAGCGVRLSKAIRVDGACPDICRLQATTQAACWQVTAGDRTSRMSPLC